MINMDWINNNGKCYVKTKITILNFILVNYDFIVTNNLVIDLQKRNLLQYCKFSEVSNKPQELNK